MCAADNNSPPPERMRMSDEEFERLCDSVAYGVPQNKRLKAEARRAREAEASLIESEFKLAESCAAKDAEIAMMKSVYQEHLNGVSVWDWKARADAAEAERDRLREALESISSWSQELQDRIIANGDALAMWRGCIAEARDALRGADAPQEREEK